MIRDRLTELLAERLARAIVRHELRRELTRSELVAHAIRARAAGADELADLMLEAARR